MAAAFVLTELDLDTKLAEVLGVFESAGTAREKVTEIERAIFDENAEDFLGLDFEEPEWITLDDQICTKAGETYANVIYGISAHESAL